MPIRNSSCQIYNPSMSRFELQLQYVANASQPPVYKGSPRHPAAIQGAARSFCYYILIYTACEASNAVATRSRAVADPIHDAGVRLRAAGNPSMPPGGPKDWIGIRPSECPVLFFY